MSNLSFHKAVWLGILSVGLTTDSKTQAQAPERDSVAVGLRPFASLRELLVDIDNSYTRLGAIRQRQLARRKDLERFTRDLQKGRESLQKERAELDQARAALDARRTEGSGAGFRVKLKADKIVDGYHFINHPYKDFASYEEAAAWLKDNGGAKGGYVLDKGTNKEVTAPPEKKDKSDIQAEMRRLAGRRRDYDTRAREHELRKQELEQGLQSLATEANEYNSLAESVSKKSAALPNPHKALDAAHLVYDENAPKGGKLGPAFDKMKEMLSQKSVGSGECTELPRALNDLGPSSTWKPGDKVLGSGTFMPLRGAATFIGGKGEAPYPNNPHGNHAVVVCDPFERDPASGRGGMLVFDQYRGKAPGFRLLKSQGGIDAPANQENIKKGSAEAEQKGYKPDRDSPTRKEYFRSLYRYYNPGDDADNYKYIK